MSNVLSSQKRALLAQWSRGRTGGASSSIPTVAETASAPLSFTQLGMWLTEQVSPGSSANNVCFCAKLVGQLDLDALGNAFRMLSKRHPLLRARIRSSSTGPIQSFPEDNVLELEREFISGDTHDESLFECLEAYAKAEFEISTQICRAKLFIRDAHEAWLGFVVHHIAFDGWSQSVLVEDLVRLYDAERGGVDAPPPRAAPNFASYVAWEAAQLSGERGKELLAYWSEQLRDLPAIATLPTDRARPIEPKLSSLVARSQIGTQVVERFQALATNTNTTSFDYFFSAFGLALSRFNGLERFAVGVPAANRNHPATAHVIGPLLNTLPLVACPDPDVSFAELVRASTQTTREAFARQDAPLEFLLSSIDVARSEGVTPLFQVLFVLQNATGHLSGIPGLQIERLPITFGTSAFDLSVALEPKNDGGMEIVAEYSEALYDRATIQSFLAYFAGLLAFFANHPEQNRVDFDRLRSLQIPLSDPYPLGASFSSRWARLVALQPNALAVRDRGHRYSYKEVHSIARALGKNFRDRGYQKGDPIALLVKRSAATFIAMLAAWYEGLLFVPISVTEPEERRDKMMAGVGATVAIDLTSIDFSQQLDNVTEEIPAFSGPAYVVFTSGTTGAPKAVCIDHASLNYVTNAWREIYGEGPHRVLQVGQMTADVFIGDAVKAMDTGGALIVADEDERLDPKALGDLLEDEEPTLFEGTPGLLLNFFETAHRKGRRLPSLKNVIFGSDYLRQSELQRVCDRFPSIRFVNGYGLTECTIESSVYDLREVPLAPRSGIAPLGKPFPGTDFLVLDEALSMLPRGAIGELYIGGPGVSLGYIADSALTGERFLETKNYGRIYRTGDLARHHGTGVFELVGRADHVLKIRGHRVDPGEVENAILALNGVRDIAIVPSTYRDQTSLVACVVLESYASIQDFSSELREKLPESMIPSRWVEFEELPRNTNGKVLRPSLVQWVTAQAEAVAAASKVSSHEHWTPQEQFVATLWEEILGHPVTDLDANFMGMGGNSVAILKVHNRLGETGHDVSIGALFSAYTVRRLSSLLDEASRDKS